MPISKKARNQMLESCHDLLERRVAVLPPLPKTIPGFDVEDIYRNHYEALGMTEDEVLRLPVHETLIPRVEAGAPIKFTLGDPLGVFKQQRFVTDPDPDPYATDAKTLWMHNRANPGVGFVLGHLPRPLWFCAGTLGNEAADEAHILSMALDLRSTDLHPDTLLFMTRRAIRHQLLVLENKHHLTTLRTLLSETKSWQHVFRCAPSVSIVWQRISGKSFKEPRGKRLHNEQYEQLEHALALAVMVPESENLFNR